MALDPERADEIFSAFGPVRVRKMFGGAGVYSGDVMFALEADDVIYLKSDASTAQAFDAEGCPPFSYVMKGVRKVMTSYRRAPDSLLEDPDEMAEWARRALFVARAAAKPGRRKARTRIAK